MSRKPREDFPGAWHHVMHRGARRAPIFLEDGHCYLFYDLVEKTIEQFEVEVHGFSLMPNHYHLLIRSRHGNLSDAMQYLNGNYTRQVNAMYLWDGPVFKGRFTSKLVRDESRLPYILAYIHLNPLRANLVTRIDSLSWTSLRAYLGRKGEPEWVTKEYFIEMLGGRDALRQYTLGLHRGGRSWPETMDLEFGFFKDRSAEAIADSHGQTKFDSRFVNPESLLDILTGITGSSRQEMENGVFGPRANPARRFAVWALREHTLMKNREIASLLNMSYNQVSNVLSRFRCGQKPMNTWIDELSIYLTNDGV